MSESQSTAERLRLYRHALGEFVDTFATVEITLFYVLRWYTKTTTNTARAVFSGVRPDTATSFFKRLAEVGVMKRDEWEALDPLLSRLTAITKLRNDILHYGTMGIREGRGFVTNAIKALTEERITRTPVSPETLNDMTGDLRKIFIHLATEHVGYPQLRADNPDVERVLRATWRYTPPQPLPPDPRQKKKKKEQKRQPPPLLGLAAPVNGPLDEKS